MFFSFPHIAIDSNGNVGSISRPNRPGSSSACGALIKVRISAGSAGAARRGARLGLLVCQHCCSSQSASPARLQYHHTCLRTPSPSLPMPRLHTHPALTTHARQLTRPPAPPPLRP